MHLAGRWNKPWCVCVCVYQLAVGDEGARVRKRSWDLCCCCCCREISSQTDINIQVEICC